MICPSCQATIPNESHFCFSCGASMTAPDLGNPHTEAALAQANLLRMRAQWAEAEERCVDVMRLSPNNIHAHSLLGDIYRDQGRFEDAAQWYRLALDLNPDSKADRVKLAHIEQEIEQRDRNSGNLLASRSETESVGTQNLLGLSPVLWLHGMTALSIVFMALVVVLIVAMRNNRRMDAFTPTGTLPDPRGTVASPNTLAESNAPLPTGKSISPAPKNNLSTDHDTSGGLPAAPLASSSRTGGAYSETEIALQNYLAQQSGLSAETTVGSVTIDPREQRVTAVLIRQQTAQNVDPAALRASLALDALHTAQAAFTADAGVQRVTISMRLNSGANRVESVFGGDIERSAAQNLPANPTTEQILTAFVRDWWTPSLAPSASNTGAPADETGR